jgi:thioredoxin 2
MSVKVVCPHCGKVNKIPQKESYTKANCGHCKASMLNQKPLEVDKEDLLHILVNSDIPVIVDFWAPWCGPCLQMAPAFEEASETLSLKAQFLKVNTEEQRELGALYNIQSIPTMIVFKGTKEHERISGAMSAGRLVNWAKQYI